LEQKVPINIYIIDTYWVIGGSRLLLTVDKILSSPSVFLNILSTYRAIGEKGVIRKMKVKFIKVSADQKEKFEIMKQERIG
jgi:hypothetical protein